MFITTSKDSVFMLIINKVFKNKPVMESNGIRILPNILNIKITRRCSSGDLFLNFANTKFIK